MGDSRKNLFAEGRKINVLCVIPTLGQGGAQKILVDFAHKLAHRESSSKIQSVSLLTFKENNENFYQPDQSISLYSTSTVRGDSVSFSSMPISACKMRRQLKAIAPDVILSFQDISNVVSILGTFGLRQIKLVVSERQDTRFYSYTFFRKILRYFLYNFSDVIVVQTSAIADQFPTFLKKKIVIVPNHIAAHSHHSKPDVADQGKFFRAIAVGRLADQKHFDLLIESALHLEKFHDSWKIDIYGSGSLMKLHQQKIEKYNLQNFIFIHKPTKDIIGKMASSHLFLFPSRYEGFPNALAEAISCGLPSIAFEEVSGCAELIRHKHNGLLLKESDRNPIAFAKSMDYMMSEPKLRKLYGLNCLEILPKYDEEVLLNQWMKLLIENELQAS